jgi:hypothetical protein
LEHWHRLVCVEGDQSARRRWSDGEGGSTLFGSQLVAVISVIAFAFVGTYAILKLMEGWACAWRRRKKLLV